MPSRMDKEKTKENISVILEKIEKITTEADLQLLAEYKALFKKEISFFRRSWVTAYLLMLFDQEKGDSAAGSYAANAKSSRRKKGDKSSARNADSTNGRNSSDNETSRYPLSDEESRRLFFSVGRSRRVFPREILGIINTKTAVAKEDIGAIRILDNYSFVQVRDTVAEKIIEALNGMSFRGRTLVVNYAKPRKIGEEESDEYPVDIDDIEEDDSDKDSASELKYESEQSQDHPDKEDV